MSELTLIYYLGLLLLSAGASLAFRHISPGLIILGIGMIIQSIVCGLQSS